MSDGAPPPERFIEAYREGGSAPWDIGRPQQAFVEVEATGRIGPSVLDVGCGTGENTLWMAERGHQAWGIDRVEAAVDKARVKAEERGLAATFRVADALDLGSLGRTFATAIDSGCFHVFDDQERVRFVASLWAVLQRGGLYHVLCFNEHTEGPGPRRVRQEEIHGTFAGRFRVIEIRPHRFSSLVHDGGAHAWFATLERIP
jgi:SAM-dependent methyltransferase